MKKIPLYAMAHARSGDKGEGSNVGILAYDERGRQYGSPKPRYLRRVEKGRWYITNYAQPF